jgi:hypothetical protein
VVLVYFTRQKINLYTLVLQVGWKKIKSASSKAYTILVLILYLYCLPIFLTAGSNTTIKKVAIGPKNKESRNHTRPLRFLLCASPPLIKARVPQPIAYPDCV